MSAYACSDCVGTTRDDIDEPWPVYTHADGCPAAAALDHMRDTDREWFDAHPGADHYWRDLHPGDLGLASLSCVGSSDGAPLRVRVQQVAPGVRRKRLPANLYVLLGTLDGDRLAARLGIVYSGGPTC